MQKWFRWWLQSARRRWCWRLVSGSVSVSPSCFYCLSSLPSPCPPKGADDTGLTRLYSGYRNVGNIIEHPFAVSERWAGLLCIYYSTSVINWTLSNGDEILTGGTENFTAWPNLPPWWSYPTPTSFRIDKFMWFAESRYKLLVFKRCISQQCITL